MDKPIRKPEETFTTIGNRQIATRGFTIDAAEHHLRDHNATPLKFKGPWCEVKCAARIFFGKATEQNRIQVRKRFGQLNGKFLDRGLLPLKKYGEHGAITHIKIFDNTSAEDIAFAQRQLQAAKEKGELSEERLKQIEEIMGISRDDNEPGNGEIQPTA